MRAPFKTILISALFSLTALVSIAYLSCNRDLCKTIICQNGGVCNGGNCTCALGYEGSNCATRSRDKFTGVWTINEKGSNTNADQYRTTIDTGAIVTDLIITNFHNFGTVPVTASVVGDTMFIYTQCHEGKYVDGIGVITPNTTYGQYDFMLVYYEVIDSVTGTVTDFGLNYGDGSLPSNWNK
jgi:hypothetical protein